MLECGVIKDNSTHGQDCSEVIWHEDVLFVAVADGVTSSEHGSASAAHAVKCAREAFLADPRGGINAFSHRLRDLIRCADWRPSGSGRTTLTVCLFYQRDDDTALMRVFAIGDSSIVLAHAWPLKESYPDSFLCTQVYGKPLVVRNSTHLYSFVDCEARRLVGRPFSGSIELAAGDVCLVFTDGMPVDDYIIDDLHRHSGSNAYLNDVIKRGTSEAADILARRLLDANAFADDATLITVSVTASYTTSANHDSHDASQRSQCDKCGFVLAIGTWPFCPHIGRPNRRE
jgi:hypothetical protein